LLAQQWSSRHNEAQNQPHSSMECNLLEPQVIEALKGCETINSLRLRHSPTNRILTWDHPRWIITILTHTKASRAQWVVTDTSNKSKSGALVC